MSMQRIDRIVSGRLCIGCGFCAASCREHAVRMSWTKGVWEPTVHEGKCSRCSRCYAVCPQSPESLLEAAQAAAENGERFGLPAEGEYYVGYASDSRWRTVSASGGALSLLATSLLESGKVDGVISSFPREAIIGESHFELRIARNADDLAKARGSHYHPLDYHRVLREALSDDGRYAFLGLPCHLRGIKRLPQEFRERLRFTLCLVCSHNVTSSFVDCLASREGIHSGEPFIVNLRDKAGIPDANNFNNVFQMPGRTIRKNRFETSFTQMWRNYFFAREACLYCADFYGNDADLSVKDAWGRLSDDPLGKSLLTVRNPELARQLRKLAEKGVLCLEGSTIEEVFESQPDTPFFKHVGVRDRLVWKRDIRRRLQTAGYGLPASRRWWTSGSRKYWSLRSAAVLSDFFYSRFGRVPVRSLIRLCHPMQSLCALGRCTFSRFSNPVLKTLCKFAILSGLAAVEKKPISSSPRVLVAGGYGYGNVGDEAQLAANLKHWRRITPECRITVLTPDPAYTERVHGEMRTELAPRRGIFGREGHEYYGSEAVFRRRYWGVAALLLFNACLLRAGLPLLGINACQARLLTELAESDILFLSGGGYLTGMTLTRLWDNMLLLRLAQMLGVHTLLSGQTIGVFNETPSRLLARWGLRRADLIYLRDAEHSPKALESIGVAAERVGCSFDDALFCDAASDEEVCKTLQSAGIEPSKSYIAVNVHYWGQAPAASRVIMREMASALDRIQEETGMQVVFVPMHMTDEEAMREVCTHMQYKGWVASHGYRVELAVGIVKKAKLCLTMKHHPIIFAMAGFVPTLSMTFDDYYKHKNIGAMKIFGQEKYVIAGVPEILCQQVISAFSGLWPTRDGVAKEIETRVEKLRHRSGEVVERWFRCSASL